MKLAVHWSVAERAQAWCQRCGTPMWEGVWPYLDPWDKRALKKEPMVFW